MTTTSVVRDLQLQMWSDLSCPWCYLGRARLRRAIEGSGLGARVDFAFRSFVLDPRAPTDPAAGVPVLEALAAKFGTSTEQAARMEDRVRVLAEAEGLPFSAQRPYASTVDTARLAHLAAEHGLGPDVFDALQREYFTGRLNPADHDDLVRVALEAGLPGDEVRETLAGERFADAVAADVATARSLGVTGVPFLVLADTYAVPGAAEVAGYTSALAAAVAALR